MTNSCMDLRRQESGLPDWETGRQVTMECSGGMDWEISGTMVSPLYDELAREWIEYSEK